MAFSFYSPMIDGLTGLNLGLPKAWVVNCKKAAARSIAAPWTRRASIPSRTSVDFGVLFPDL